MEISDIERNTYENYGIDTEILYGNTRGKEPQRVTEVRYVYMYILHYDMGYTGGSLMDMFHRCPRMVWKALSLAKFRVAHDRQSKAIYDKLREPYK